MKKIELGTIAAAAVFAFSLLLGSGPLHAKAEPVAPAKKAKNPSKSKPGKLKKESTRLVAFPEDTRNKHGSRETEYQRSERLSRECKGAVNAGACAGYTR